MTVSPVTTSTTSTNTSVSRQRFSNAFDAIANKLGMSKAELVAKLQSGVKMKDLEAAKGVSKDDVIAAAASALQSSDPSLSADAAKKLATSFYDGKAGHRHHHHGHSASGQPVAPTPVANPGAQASGVDFMS